MSYGQRTSARHLFGIEWTEHAASDPDDYVRLLIDDTSTVRQIFIQTAAMKEMFVTFPEVVMLDGTSSINNCWMPLYAFWCRMGSHGQLVGLCLLAGEDSSQMRVILEMFAKANRNIAQTHWQVPKQKKKKKVQKFLQQRHQRELCRLWPYAYHRCVYAYGWPCA